ncbi:MAG: hypothetical protein RSA74_04400 [Chryseobacterium sp.]
MRISIDYAWLGTIPDLPLMMKEAVRIGKLNTNEIAGPKYGDLKVCCNSRSQQYLQKR